MRHFLLDCAALQPSGLRFMTHLTLATRKSPLALWQANHVKNRLESLHPGLCVDLLGLTTTADRTRGPLQANGGKGLFVKELEEALLTGRADIAVHSMKDMPVTLPDDLILPVMCERADPRDVLVAETPLSLATLPQGTRIGTGSPRRECQLLALWPALAVTPLRGNVETRLRKVQEGTCSAIVLALAGLSRLGLTGNIQLVFSLDEMLPAAGQGAIGVQCRLTDIATQALITPLNHAPTLLAVNAERAVCRALRAGCHTPLAVYADIKSDLLTLRARIGSADGKILIESSLQGTPTSADTMAGQIADHLLEQGAHPLLEHAP